MVKRQTDEQRRRNRLLNDHHRFHAWIDPRGRVSCVVPDSSLVPVKHRALSLDLIAIRLAITCSCGDQWGDRCWPVGGCFVAKDANVTIESKALGSKSDQRAREIETLGGYFAHLMRAEGRTIPPLGTWAWAMIRTRVASGLWMRYEKRRRDRQHRDAPVR